MWHTVRGHVLGATAAITGSETLVDAQTITHNKLLAAYRSHMHVMTEAFDEGKLSSTLGCCCCCGTAPESLVLFGVDPCFVN
jgi:hypothetical protein